MNSGAMKTFVSMARVLVTSLTILALGEQSSLSLETALPTSVGGEMLEKTGWKTAIRYVRQNIDLHSQHLQQKARYEREKPLPYPEPGLSEDLTHAVSMGHKQCAKGDVSCDDMKVFLMVDGRPGPEFDDVGKVVFGAQGKRIAYVGTYESPHRERVILDGEQQPLFDNIGIPKFSTNGKHCAYSAVRQPEGNSPENGYRNRMQYIIDGQGTPLFDNYIDNIDNDYVFDLGRFVFSPDGERTAYVAHYIDSAKYDKNRGYYDVREQETVVIDGKMGPMFDGIKGEPYFSDDGKHLAYLARKGKKIIFVVDSIPQWEIRIVTPRSQKSVDYPSELDEPVFTPNAQRAAYFETDGLHWYAIIDGKRSPPFTAYYKRRDKHDCMKPPVRRSIVEYSGTKIRDLYATIPFSFVSKIIFSLDGTRFAYTGERGNKRFVNINGKQGPLFDMVSNPVFSADGKQCAYFARAHDKYYILVNGVLKKTYTGSIEVDRLFYNGNHLVFVVTRNNQYNLSVVIDDIPGPEYHRFADSKCFAVTPDGKHLTYLVNDTKKEFTVIDGKPAEPFDRVEEAVYSPQATHLAYFAKKKRTDGKTRSMIVMDGITGPEFEDIELKRPIFLDENTIEYLAFTKDSVFAVKHTLH